MINDNGYHYYNVIMIGRRNMYVCLCNKITDTQILFEVERGARSANEVCEKLSIASQCGKCKQCATKMIRRKLTEMKKETRAAAVMMLV